MSGGAPGIRQRLGNTLAVLRLAPTFLAFGLLRHVVRVDTLARWAWATPRPRGSATPNQLAARVFRTSRLAGMPDRDCLQRSLLLYRELSRVGADPVLALGFRRDRGTVEGHAWVIAGGRAVGESQDALDAFVPALTFGRDGRLVAPAPEAIHSSLERTST